MLHAFSGYRTSMYIKAALGLLFCFGLRNTRLRDRCKNLIGTFINQFKNVT